MKTEDDTAETLVEDTQPGPVHSAGRQLAASPPRRGGAVALANPMEMLSYAISKGQGVEVIKQLMDLQDRWQRSEALRAFNEAISDFRALVGPILKNKKVDYTPQGKERVAYDYENLAGIADQIDPLLAQFGLSYRWRSSNGPNEPIRITVIISHRAGHSEENTLAGPPDSGPGRNPHQAIASACTYLARYTLKLALGLSTAMKEDDDGRAASLNTLEVESAVDRYRRLFEAVTTEKGLNELKERLAAEPDDIRNAGIPHYRKARDRLAGPRKAPPPDQAAGPGPTAEIDPVALYQRAPNLYLDAVRSAVKGSKTRGELADVWDRLVEPVKDLLGDADYSDEIIPGFDARGAVLESARAKEEGTQP